MKRILATILLGIAAAGATTLTAPAHAATVTACQAQGYTGRDLIACNAFTSWNRHRTNRNLALLARTARRDVTFPAVRTDAALLVRDVARHASRATLARDAWFLWDDLFTNPDA